MVTSGSRDSFVIAHESCMSEIHSGVTSSVTYGNYEMKTAFSRSKTKYYEKVHLVIYWKNKLGRDWKNAENDI